jgi:hypothetical protein
VSSEIREKSSDFCEEQLENQWEREKEVVKITKY